MPSTNNVNTESTSPLSCGPLAWGEQNPPVKCNSLISDVAVETGPCKGVSTLSTVSDTDPISIPSIPFSCDQTLARSSLKPKLDEYDSHPDTLPLLPGVAPALLLNQKLLFFQWICFSDVCVSAIKKKKKQIKNKKNLLKFEGATGCWTCMPQCCHGNKHT